MCFTYKTESVELLDLQIESLIFVSSEPLKLDDLIACLEAYHKEKVDRSMVLESIDNIKTKYGSEDFAFELQEIAEGYQFMTKGAFHPIIKAYLNQMNQKRLSRTALETLAIIAYKQPITKAETVLAPPGTNRWAITTLIGIGRFNTVPPASNKA